MRTKKWVPSCQNFHQVDDFPIHSRDPRGSKDPVKTEAFREVLQAQRIQRKGPGGIFKVGATKTMTAWAKRIRPGNFVVQLPYILHMHYVYILFITYIYIYILIGTTPHPVTLANKGLYDFI